ncbi:Wilms tumor protein 1-interacting protein homolog isoform X1 [Ranitomeya imitator]|uniref:Wilms tumor protein 1-interacting protein homolog isoform X1 n=2 Tax=Ranitomeya imitator TaxID=111125 RepID=UPI0037E7AB89
MEQYPEEEDVGRLMDELCLEEGRPRRLNGAGLQLYHCPAEPYRSRQEAEVALPCYPGRPGMYPGSSGGSSPRSSTACPELGRLSSPRCSLAQYEAPSPRSSYASTASDTSKHSSPRASLHDGGSKPSSARTSGISLGYDQRHGSPRSSYCPGEAAADGGGGGGGGGRSLQDGRANTLASPRSSISSHSSRSSRGSMGPSPRSSMLAPGLQEEALPGEGAELGGYKLLAHSPPRHEQLTAEPATASYGYSSARGSATLHRFKLPYQVTPGKESGPSPAERRLEALTLELERELEMHMKKEYFGICIKCGKGVYGASQACQAMGNLFHTNCFTCCSCGRRLRGKAFYNVNGKVYCEEDFLYSGFQQTADKCFVCGHLIMEMILQALGKSYHPGCFRCVVCNECLDGVPFTVDVENNIYCVKDYHTVFAPKCASCNQPILPAQGSEETIRVVSMDKDYHVECYHCEDCHLQLNDEEGHRCYPLQGHLLCHGCHIRRISVNIPAPHPANYPMHVTEL